ncbi:MauE/DoxX family redox-associated membrane protein [Embleya sp. NPDC008237]|uniref:MauE/DoxX family redox-associated membrane protein n=1 Tax=Embleya sp. NPDC008237 TaxID=3363978 RepID=UPI0036E479D5
MPYLVVAIRCAIALIFAVSAFSKVRRRASFGLFVASLREMAVLPAALVRPTAVAVVAAEFAVCTAVANPFGRAWYPWGLAMAGALLVAFTVGIVRVRRAGSRATCRCFGASTRALGPLHVVRNTVWALAALGAAWCGFADADGGAVRAGGVSTALGVGVLLAVSTVELEDIVDLFRAPAATPGDISRAG